MSAKIKNFPAFFNLISYAVMLCGFLSLLVSGGVENISLMFFGIVLILAWYLEGSVWQISERLGTLSVIFVVPLFYLNWKYKIFGVNENQIFGMLARVILILAGIKLLQRKTDRDWIFLYLMAFFEVLLAAGMSISPLYLATMILFFLTIICAIIAFEIKKTTKTIGGNISQNNFEKAQTVFAKTSPLKISFTAVVLLTLIIGCGTPLFFALPRVSSAGLGGTSNSLSGMTGFSDSVKLGEIGELLQSDQVVLRARLENSQGKDPRFLKWRGVALDNFDNKSWSKSKTEYTAPIYKREGDFFLLGYASDSDNLIVQTVYLEPIDVPALFAVSRPVAVQGNFKFLRKNANDEVIFQRNDFDRLSYKVYSDASVPDTSLLKADNNVYTKDDQRYLQLPTNLDGRIADLAEELTIKNSNRYEKARTIEHYLQTQFGYTLQLKAQGEQPLADFLFNVREGHCEYFASAMAIMLRTQGIATRVVNGFQQGEYNDTADVYVVRQRDAHSWVEVYFPGENAWIPFDPTPSAGQIGEKSATGIIGQLSKYAQALETFWIQYFVTYDNQEQRSLARSVKNSLSEYQSSISGWLNNFQSQIIDWWKNVRGDKGSRSSASAIAYGIGYLLAAIFCVFLFIYLANKIKKHRFWRKVYDWFGQTKKATIIEFYERMQTVLANQGLTRAPHQTPLEFAFALEMPEAVKITEKYNRVRFGEKELTDSEAAEIENWLKNLADEK